MIERMEYRYRVIEGMIEAELRGRGVDAVIVKLDDSAGCGRWGWIWNCNSWSSWVRYYDTRQYLHNNTIIYTARSNSSWLITV